MSDGVDAAAWGADFRALWRDARPAGRRRAADLATGVVGFDAALGAPRRPPPVAIPDPERWAAAVGEDGTIAPRGKSAGTLPDAADRA